MFEERGLGPSDLGLFLSGSQLAAGELEDGQHGVINQAMAQALQNAAPLTYNATKIDTARRLLASGLERLTA